MELHHRCLRTIFAAFCVLLTVGSADEKIDERSKRDSEVVESVQDFEKELQRVKRVDVDDEVSLFRVKRTDPGEELHRQKRIRRSLEKVSQDLERVLRQRREANVGAGVDDIADKTEKRVRAKRVNDVIGDDKDVDRRKKNKVRLTKKKKAILKARRAKLQRMADKASAKENKREKKLMAKKKKFLKNKDPRRRMHKKKQIQQNKAKLASKEE